MPLIELDRPRAIERIGAKLRAMQYLRGTGPVSMEFFQWVDETVLVLEQSFGAESPLVSQFLAAVGDRSPIYSQGIPPHGEWGLLARLDRAEAVLRRGIATLGEAPAAAAVPAAEEEAAAAPAGPALTRNVIFGRDRPCPEVFQLR
jgi:hypothetical protein